MIWKLLWAIIALFLIALGGILLDTPYFKTGLTLSIIGFVIAVTLKGNEK